MNILATHIGKNTPGINKDTGYPWRDGNTFRDECYSFAHRYQLEGNDAEVLPLASPGPGAGEDLIWTISKYGGRKECCQLDVLAVFDHGVSRGLPRYKLNHKNIGELADAIAGAAGEHITILLYACSTGRGHYWWDPKKKRNLGGRIRAAEKVDHREGWAMHLCAELYMRGVKSTIIAHMVPGHTTENPYLAKVYSHLGELGGQVTREIISAPHMANWNSWRTRLKTSDRFHFWEEL